MAEKEEGHAGTADVRWLGGPVPFESTHDGYYDSPSRSVNAAGSSPRMSSSSRMWGDPDESRDW